MLEPQTAHLRIAFPGAHGFVGRELCTVAQNYRDDVVAMSMTAPHCTMVRVCSAF
jgi:hypothetical protein